LINEALRDYLELKRSLREIDLKIGDTEEKLNNLFENTGQETIQTYLGKLTKIERDGKSIWSIEI